MDARLVFRLFLLAALLALVVLVILRRRAAQRWTAASRHHDIRSRTFRKVWLQKVPPRAAMRAYKDRLVGTLAIDPGQQTALFRAKDGTVVDLANITDVRMGGRGTDFVNTWIEVRTSREGEDNSLFINDGGWLGWRPLVTPSNMRIASALVGASTESPHAAQG